MKKLYMMIPALTLAISLTGCKPNLDSAKEDVNHYIKDTGLNAYIDNIDKDVIYLTEEKPDDTDSYNIDISVDTSTMFDDLDRLEQLKYLSAATEYISESAMYPECGQARCHFGDLTVDTKKNIYSMAIESHDFDETMVVNNDVYEREDLEAEKAEVDAGNIDDDIADDDSTEPSVIMADWPKLSPGEKMELIKACLRYEINEQSAKNTPVKIIGTEEDFVKLIDDRYAEIEGLSQSEQLRMFGTTVAGQLGVMGHTKHLIDFDF
ncbi:hypothetical protein [Priestia megaterium]|uniref:hypothetical protein n=1 Tax=Priestia megaterium TaxID=1404 RepID=UPI000BFE5EF0|nr:hypothetical protein [Priestia megaterium]PGQ88266.1 hypothetical protein COA18_04885 [Priestia megaterium]